MSPMTGERGTQETEAVTTHGTVRFAGEVRGGRLSFGKSERIEAGTNSCPGICEHSGSD